MGIPIRLVVEYDDGITKTVRFEDVPLLKGALIRKACCCLIRAIEHPFTKSLPIIYESEEKTDREMSMSSWTFR